jgi:peroxiredoxin
MLNKLMVIAAVFATACGPPARQEPESAPYSDNDYRPSDFEVEDETPRGVPNCPNRDNTVGLNIGDTFPSVQYPNAEWDPVNIKSMCGNKGILVISATEWCMACIVELYHLATVAPDWKDRGGVIYYTLYEDRARQPASKATLVKLEQILLEDFGYIPFQILSDRTASLPRSLGRGLSLPLAWILDEEMVIKNFAEGTNGDMVSRWMEELL